MARRSRWTLLAGAVVLVLGLGEAPGFAVQAGQFCANAAANTITVADNGATVQCQYNPNSDRYQWVAIVTTTTTTVAPGAANQTRIISITQAPVPPPAVPILAPTVATPPTATPAAPAPAMTTGLLERTG
jgi:hypothetical protein